jgi:hypothetical protein
VAPVIDAEALFHTATVNATLLSSERQNAVSAGSQRLQVEIVRFDGEVIYVVMTVPVRFPQPAKVDVRQEQIVSHALRKKLGSRIRSGQAKSDIVGV